MTDETKTVDLAEATKAVAGLQSTFSEMKKTQAAIEAEIKANGAADVLLTEKMSKMEASMNGFQEKQDAYILEQKRKERVQLDGEGKPVDLEAKARDFSALIGAQKGGEGPNLDAKGLAEYNEAYEKLMRNRFNPDLMTEAERKALSVGSDRDGGYLVSPDMSGRIVKKVYETSPMRAYASVQAISGPSLDGSYDNDEADAGWVGELSARSETATPQVGEWNIVVHEMFANPAVSQQLLDDANVNIESWLNEKIAAKFARKENQAFVTGNGVKKPVGFLTYPDGTDLTNSIERIKTGASGAFASAPAGADVLISTIGLLKSNYLGNSNWFMNRTTQAAVRLLKNSDGDSIWVPSIAAGVPNTLLGYSIAPFEDMPAIAAGSLSVAFGDMRSSYQIVDRMGVRMLRDPFSNKPKVHFYATKRVGGDMINGEALKLVEFAA